MNIYIISWFGKNKPEKREYNHGRQMEWVKANGLTPYVVCQEYEDHQRRDDVTYLGNNEKLLPGEARNIAKEHFFNSDEDWAIFADDDSWSLNINEDQNWLDLFDKDLSQIDCFVPQGHMVPYVKQYNDMGQVGVDNYVFKRLNRLKSSFYVLRNTRKHYGFDAAYERPRLIPSEDVQYGFSMITKGMGVYTCMNIKLIERYSESTWALDDRREKTDQVLTELAKEYNIPVKVTEKGLQVTRYDELWKNNDHPKKVLVPINTESEWFE